MKPGDDGKFHLQVCRTTSNGAKAEENNCHVANETILESAAEEKSDVEEESNDSKL